MRQLEEWVSGLKPRTPLTVGVVAEELGVTRYEATKLLEAEQGNLLDTGTWEGGRVRKRDARGNWYWTRQGKTWFTA